MEILTIVVAAAALVVSLGQWFAAWRSERIRLLLGEKETVAFEAIRVSGRRSFAGRRTYEALVLASLLESSNRARIVIYRALNVASPKRRGQIMVFKRALDEAAKDFASSIDRGSFDRRMSQLERALPWIVDPSRLASPPGSAPS